jgi:hypothetical protein
MGADNSPEDDRWRISIRHHADVSGLVRRFVPAHDSERGFCMRIRHHRDESSFVRNVQWIES